MIQLSEEETLEVDKMMADHMYGHQISNSYSNFACYPQCRVQALQYAINKVLQAKEELESG